MAVEKHQGGCHCRKVEYEVNVDPNGALVCNCSHCLQRGLMLRFVPRSEFTLLKGEDNLTEYRFNTEKIQHLFCTTCGVESFAYGVGPDGSEMAAINVRCLDDVDIEKLETVPFDGKKL